jgi:hypothetical protein
VSAVRRVARRVLMAAGLLQICALFTPAAHVRVLGDMTFFSLPTAGAVLLALAILTIGVGLRPGGWWRFVPGLLSAAVLAVSRWRIIHSPSATFADPLLRHAVHPSWGFWPMGIVVGVGLVAATLASRSNVDAGVDLELRPEGAKVSFPA